MYALYMCTVCVCACMYCAGGCVLKSSGSICGFNHLKAIYRVGVGIITKDGGRGSGIRPIKKDLLVPQRK